MNASAAGSSVAARGYVGSILAGLMIAAAGLIPWTLLARLNARVLPDVPWAALITVAYLALLLAWLNGRGAPASTRETRRQRFRLWPPDPRDPARDCSLAIGSIVILLALLYGVWVIVGRLSALPDLSAFPTTSYRWSMFIMGGVTSGVVEEAAYRG